MPGFNLDAFKTILKSSADERADVVAMARTAESAERYEDMCQFMDHLVNFCLEHDLPLSVEERNLLSVAYKNVIGTRRASWRTLTGESESTDEKHATNVKKYNEIVQEELVKTCLQVLDILKKLIPDAPDPEANVFYLKMAGDYYRYLAESNPSSDANYAAQAGTFYSQAYEAATQEDDNGEAKLPATHPIRLGLALNYSVCHYEILRDQKSACELAKKAFDDAIAKLDKLEEADYKDSTLIMQLLRDNLTLWSASEEDLGVQVEDLSDDEN